MQSLSCYRDIALRVSTLNQNGNGESRTGDSRVKMLVEYFHVADLAELTMALRFRFMSCFYSNQQEIGRTFERVYYKCVILTGRLFTYHLRLT